MTTQSNQHINDQLDLYALGALEPGEQTAVDDHLQGCVQCRTQLVEAKRLVEVLAWTTEQFDPPPIIRERLMARIQATMPQARPSTMVPAAVAPYMQSAPTDQVNTTPETNPALAPSQSVDAARLHSSVRPLRPKRWWQQTNTGGGANRWSLPRLALGLATLMAVLALLANNLRLQQQAGQLQANVQEQQRVLSIVREPGARLITLGRNGASSGSGQLVVNGGGNQAFLLTDGLPALPQGKSYELWLISDSKPAPAGVFQVDTQGNATIVVQSNVQIKNSQVAAITVEPNGGSAQPTSTPIFVAKLQGT